LEIQQGLADECGVMILGFEVHPLMTANDPRMWSFGVLESIVLIGTWLPMHRAFPSGLCSVGRMAHTTVLTSDTNSKFEEGGAQDHS